MARRPDPADKTRAADSLFVVALLVTLFVTSFGSTLLWRLYESYRSTLTLRPGNTQYHEGEPLVICIARTPGGPAEWITFAKVFAKLERDLDRPVELHYTLDRAESRKMLKDGSIDLTFLAIQDYFNVEEKVPVQLVATPVIGGHQQDAAVLVVRADGSIKSIDDLRGSHLVIADDLAGVAYAHWLFDRQPEQFDDFFGEVEVGGVQDTNLTRVANGHADVTCVRRSALSSWPEDAFLVLRISPEFGMPPLAARADLDPATIAAVRKSLVSSSTASILPRDSAIDGFIVPAESDYDFARVLYRTKRELPASIEQGVAR